MWIETLNKKQLKFSITDFHVPVVKRLADINVSIYSYVLNQLQPIW